VASDSFGNASIPLAVTIERVVCAKIKISPSVINLESAGKWITCTIKLPGAYDIDVNTVKLIVGGGEVQAELQFDSLPVVKFSREKVQAFLDAGMQVVKVVGFADGIPFEGSATIRGIAQ
jgi:hypothetical protein